MFTQLVHSLLCVSHKATSMWVFSCYLFDGDVFYAGVQPMGLGLRNGRSPRSSIGPSSQPCSPNYFEVLVYAVGDLLAGFNNNSVHGPVLFHSVNVYDPSEVAGSNLGDNIGPPTRILWLVRILNCPLIYLALFFGVAHTFHSNRLRNFPSAHIIA